MVHRTFRAVWVEILRGCGIDRALAWLCRRQWPVRAPRRLLPVTAHMFSEHPHCLHYCTFFSQPTSLYWARSHVSIYLYSKSNRL